MPQRRHAAKPLIKKITGPHVAYIPSISTAAVCLVCGTRVGSWWHFVGMLISAVGARGATLKDDSVSRLKSHSTSQDAGGHRPSAGYTKIHHTTPGTESDAQSTACVLPRYEQSSGHLPFLLPINSNNALPHRCRERPKCQTGFAPLATQTNLFIHQELLETHWQRTCPHSINGGAKTHRNNP